MKKIKKITAVWEALDTDITVNKREMILLLLCCTMAGVIFGLLFSPRKNVTIGSNNASNNVDSGILDKKKRETSEEDNGENLRGTVTFR